MDSVKIKMTVFSIPSVLRNTMLFFILLTSTWAQTQVKAEIDTVFIKIGEQINYTITVEADSLDLVYFPENQTFSPLEMVEALKVDTVAKDNKLVLQRMYTLTQFDSGAYTIPPQRVAINEQPFFTDSFHIKVADVVVDTTKQKMFDIKPLIKVEKSNAKMWWAIFFIVLGLALIGALVYWFFLRRKPLTEEEIAALLPPYDRALLQLKELENSKYLIEDEFKKYYSELTNIVRSYLDEEVQVTALESTTDELIAKLELMKDAGRLDLMPETIDRFKKILQTADLVKFAKSKPSIAVAKDDRSSIEAIVVRTKEAMPEPTMEELLQNEEYLEEMAKKKQRKRIYIAAAVFAFLIIGGTVFTLTYYGYKKVRDTVFGYPTKELLENEWIASSYGFPPVELETPEVLLRQEIQLPEEAQEVVDQNHLFSYGSYLGLFSITVNATTYKEQIDPDFQAALGAMLTTLEASGIKNITTKEEEFQSKSGVNGLKVYGSGQVKSPDNKSRKLKYSILYFGGKGFMQQLMLSWEDGDEYAEKIVERILASVDVKVNA